MSQYTFDNHSLDRTMPDLTIGVRDGNLMYTHPEQLLNRKRCRCFEEKYESPYENLLWVIRYKFYQTVPPASQRISNKAKKLTSRLREKLDSFFISKDIRY